VRPAQGKVFQRRERREVSCIELKLEHVPSKFYPKGKIRRFFEEERAWWVRLFIIPFGLIFNPFPIVSVRFIRMRK